MEETDKRIINRIQASRQYMHGDYPYFVWPYKGIEAICFEELSWLVKNLAKLVPPGTDTLLSVMTDGDLLTMPLSFHMGLPVIICRDRDYQMVAPLKFTQKTGYYTRELYLSKPNLEAKICIVDAIISTGGTVCAAGRALLDAGYDLTGVVTAIMKTDFQGLSAIENALALTPRTIFTLQRDLHSSKLLIRRSIN